MRLVGLTILAAMAAAAAGQDKGPAHVNQLSPAPANKPSAAPAGRSALSGLEAASQPALLDVAAHESPVIFPKVTVAPPKKPPVLAENSQITDRLARVDRLAGYPLPIIDDPQVGHLHLLPNALLEELERVRQANPQARFRLSGDVQVYRNAYYLILTRVLLAAEPTSMSAPAVAAVDPPPVTTTSAPTSIASPEDVRDVLLNKPTGKPVVPVIADTAPPPAPSVVPAGNAPLPHGPGKIVMNRLVRLTGPDEGGWYQVAFESDNTLREPPLRVLPNEQLQRLEGLAKPRLAGNVFQVSGEIVIYRGIQYILLRSVIRMKDMDQF